MIVNVTILKHILMWIVTFLCEDCKFKYYKMFADTVFSMVYNVLFSIIYLFLQLLGLDYIS